MRYRYLLLFLALLLLMFSCTPLKRIKYFQAKDGNDKTEFQHKPKTYRIQRGDMLFIKIIGLDDQTDKYFNVVQNDNVGYSTTFYTYFVNDSGQVYLPVCGRIKVEGLTMEEASDTIKAALNPYILSAHVVVKVTDFHVSVLGEVGKQGNYTVNNPNLNIYEALALAGDITVNGDRKNVKIVRKENNNKTKIITVDLTDRSIIESDNYYLKSGDIVYVEPLRAKQFSTNPMPIGTIISIITSTLSTTILLINILK